MKRKLSDFGILLFFSIFILVVFLLQKEEQFESVRYSIARDDAVALEKDTELKCTFRLKKGDFRGISIQFQADDSFTDEQIHAELTDTETGIILASKLLPLRYERIENSDSGSGLFFSLPVILTEDKAVSLSLVLSGPEIYVTPRLVISSSS